MCNCNRGRNSINNAARSNSVNRNNTVTDQMVKVQLMVNSPLVFYGSFTGRTYRLKNINDITWVDKRDAVNLGNINGLQVFD